jgi:hypothetical protein
MVVPVCLNMFFLLLLPSGQVPVQYHIFLFRSPVLPLREAYLARANNFGDYQPMTEVIRDSNESTKTRYVMVSTPFMACQSRHRAGKATGVGYWSAAHQLP